MDNCGFVKDYLNDDYDGNDSGDFIFLTQKSPEHLLPNAADNSDDDFSWLFEKEILWGIRIAMKMWKIQLCLKVIWILMLVMKFVRM